MKRLRIAVCDDDADTLAYEVGMVKKLMREMYTDCVVDSFPSADMLMRDGGVYDILFMDVELGEKSGIEAARRQRLLNEDCQIFFVTNHEDYIDDALDLHALRFWIKPVDEERMRRGIESALRNIREAVEMITVVDVRRERAIKVKHIVYIHAEERKTHIFTVDGDFMVENIYKEIRSRIEKAGPFFEIARGYCINLQYVQDFNKNMVQCGKGDRSYRLEISRRRYKLFETAFVRWGGIR